MSTDSQPNAAPAFRVRRDIGASAALVITAIAVATAVLVGCTIDLLVHDRPTSWFMVVLVLAGIAVNELTTRTRRARAAQSTTATQNDAPPDRWGGQRSRRSTP